ncbi:MAG: hypothetical protein JRN20_14370, partial [Nitrososphaerota archaeon]|nr:hypothetical protein [Nitrososphaerota archaeon]
MDSAQSADESKGRRRRRELYAIGVLALVLLGFPLISLYAEFSSLAVNTFIDYWNYFAIVLFVILAIFSMYVMLHEQSERHGQKESQVLGNSLKLVFKYKHLTIPAVVLSVVSLLGWLSGTFSPLFSLDLILSVVIILALETLFHLSFNLWPNKLRNSQKLQKAVLALLVILGLFSSLFIFGLVGGLLIIALIFMGIVFVGGIGSVTIIDLVSSEVSHHFKPTKKLHFLYVFGFVGLLLGLVTINGDYISSLHSSESALSVELSTLQGGPGFSSLFIETALVLGLAYLIYSLLRRVHWKNASTLVYLVVLMSVAGFFLFYLVALADTDWAAALSKSNSLAASILDIFPSFALFVIGYSQLLIELPRKVAAKLSLEEDKFLAALTLLVIFSALAEFLSWSLYGKPGLFLAEVDIIQFLAIP